MTPAVVKTRVKSGTTSDWAHSLLTWFLVTRYPFIQGAYKGYAMFCPFVKVRSLPVIPTVRQVVASYDVPGDTS